MCCHLATHAVFASPISGHYVQTTGAVPAMKPEATAIGDPQDGRWKITLMFDGRRFCIPKFRYSTLQQMTRQWRHWWFPTTSCFGVTNHSEAASLWLVTQDRATINSGSPPSCGVTFWQRLVASPSEIGWLASKVSRYLSILCLWCKHRTELRPQITRRRFCEDGTCTDRQTHRQIETCLPQYSS